MYYFIALIIVAKTELPQVTNAFDSPSIIQYAKDPKISGDPFKSPAIRMNGGLTDSTSSSVASARSRHF